MDTFHWWLSFIPLIFARIIEIAKINQKTMKAKKIHRKKKFTFLYSRNN
uniref:Uncharacterized protein n=1 Tax=Ascaris lumbricoides TaxID=6252 RepID=A0A0M3IGH7_ASCLU